MADQGISNRDAAEQLKLTAGYVGMLARGENVPSLKTATKIAKWSDGAVVLDSWPQEPLPKPTPKEPRPNAFRRYLMRHDLNYKTAAEMLGIKYTYVSALARGRATPTKDLAELIEQVTNRRVAITSWSHVR